MIQFIKFHKNNTKKTILFFSVFLMLFVAPFYSVNAQNKYVVVLDAGHGGKDPGNLGNGYKEKQIALKVVLAVGKELKSDSDIKVIYTRKSDKFIELHNRAKIANKNKADLFVSVHCDAFRKARAFGAGTFVLGLRGNKGNLEMAKRENAVILLEDNYKSNYDYDPNSPESVIGLSVLQEDNLDESLAFASMVQTNFIKAKRYDRSVKQDNFLVLRETVMPSVLIELGFLTNKAEGKFLNSKSGQIKMAKSIANAIRKYVNQLKINTVKKEVVKKVEKPKTEIKKVVVKPKKPTPKKKITEKKNKIVVEKPKKVETKEIITSQIEFKVQVAASKKYISPKSSVFLGLKNIEVMVIDQYHKYYYGNTTKYSQIKKYLKEAKVAGIKGAFVVAFENRVKIPLKEAIKKQ